MSEQASAKREWRFYLDEMIDFARAVPTYTQGLDQDAFVANRLVFDCLPSSSYFGQTR